MRLSQFQPDIIKAGAATIRWVSLRFMRKRMSMMANEPKIRQLGNCCPTKTRNNPNQGRVYDLSGLAPALTAAEGGNRMPFIMAVRQLTELESWRLMGFADDDFYKAQKALNETFYHGKNRSSSQLRKMAGNSICVPVAQAILQVITSDVL